MSNDLEVLADNRNALLLAEVAAWLHMFGKFHEKFLEGDHDMDTKIPDDVPVELAQLLKDKTWTGESWGEFSVKNFNAKRLGISDLITRHRRGLKPGNEGLVQLMTDAHGRGSRVNSNENGVSPAFGEAAHLLLAKDDEVRETVRDISSC